MSDKGKGSKKTASKGKGKAKKTYQERKQEKKVFRQGMAAGATTHAKPDFAKR